MQPKHPDLLYPVLRSFCSKSTPFAISHIRINEPLQHCSVYTSIHLHTFPLPCSPNFLVTTNLQPATVILMVPTALSVSPLVDSARATVLLHLRM